MVAASLCCVRLRRLTRSSPRTIPSHTTRCILETQQRQRRTTGITGWRMGITGWSTGITIYQYFNKSTHSSSFSISPSFHLAPSHVASFKTSASQQLRWLEMNLVKRHPTEQHLPRLCHHNQALAHSCFWYILMKWFMFWSSTQYQSKNHSSLTLSCINYPIFRIYFTIQDISRISGWLATLSMT